MSQNVLTQTAGRQNSPLTVLNSRTSLSARAKRLRW